MITRLARNATAPLFRFRGCLHAKQGSKVRTATTVALPPTVDDKALIQFFDDPSRVSFAKGLPTGIFGHPTLTSPGALETIAGATLQRAQLLTERILRAPQSRSEMFRVVKNLDRLSDLLCSVVDLAEFIRNAHPERAWVESANALYEALSEFMNILNTHVGLYDVRPCTLYRRVLLNLYPDPKNCIL
jgi:intermediate peptidase